MKDQKINKIMRKQTKIKKMNKIKIFKYFKVKGINKNLINKWINKYIQ